MAISVTTSAVSAKKRIGRPVRRQVRTAEIIGSSFASLLASALHPPASACVDRTDRRALARWDGSRGHAEPAAFQSTFGNKQVLSLLRRKRASVTARLLTSSR